MNNQLPLIDEHMSCHSIVLAFEKAFRNPDPPLIDDYRTGAQASSLSLLLELILSDMEMRHRNGTAISFNHYLNRYKQIETHPEILIRLMHHDVQLKRQAGLTINPREYPSQYPIPRQFKNDPATINISGYEINREIGRGGMSTVYLARQASLNRMVALKALRAEANNIEPKETIRFLAEAELIGSIRHPNIVQIYDYGSVNGRSPFLALEYLAGGTLANRLVRGPIAPEEAARLVSLLASGIHHAHSLGMVHRDLKPGNILFDENGVPKIIDFGLAKRVSCDITRTQILMGTPAYMAPEQADKKAKFVGPTADVWALGAILYECITGKRAFASTDNVEVLHAIRYDIPERPTSINSKLPVDLELICLKCLEKIPEERYGSAESLELDLLAWLDHRPLSIKKPSVFGRASKWIRRNKIMSSAMLAVFLTLLAATMISGFFGVWALNEREVSAKRANEAENEKKRADAKTRLAEEESARLDFQRNRSEKLLYANHLQSAERAWEANRPEIAYNNLDDCRWDLRGPEHDFLFSRFTTGQLAFYGHRFIVSAVAISPDCKTIVSGDSGGTVRVWDLSHGTELLQSPKRVSGAITSIQFSPQGSEIAIWGRKSARLYTRTPSNEWTYQPTSITDGASENGMYVTGPVWRLGSLMVSDHETPSALFLRQLSTKTDRVLLKHSPYKQLGNISHTAISPGGDQIAVARGSSVTIHDANTGKRIGNVLYSISKSFVSAMAYSPDSTVLAVAWNNGLLRLYGIDGNEISEKLNNLVNHDTPNGATHSIAFTPDSQLMLTGGSTMGLTAWDWRKGRIAWVRQGHRNAINSITVSSNGRFAVTGGDDCTIRIWDLLKTKNDRITPDINGNISAIACSQDGSSMACIDRTTNQVLVTKPGTQIIDRRYTDVSLDVNLLAMTSDGKSMAMPCKDGTVRVIRQQTGRFALTTGGWTGKVTGLAISEDGRLLAICTAHSGSMTNRSSVRMIEISSGKTLWVNETSHHTPVTASHFIQQSLNFVTADHEGGIFCWEATTGKQIGNISKTIPNKKTMPSKITCFASSSDGSLLAIGDGGGNIVVLNVSDWSLASQWKNPAYRIFQLAFSKDSQRLLFGFRLHSGRTQLGFLDWRFNLNTVSVEVDDQEFGSALALQIASGNMGPIMFLGHSQGLRLIGSERHQDHYWLRRPSSKINRLTAIDKNITLEATFAEQAPVRWSLVTGRILDDNDQEPVNFTQLPERDLTFYSTGNQVVVVDQLARKRNRYHEIEFCNEISVPITYRQLLGQPEKSGNALPPIAHAFHLNRDRQLSPWNNSRALYEWWVVTKAGNSSMAQDLRTMWCADLIGRSLITTPTPAGQIILPGYRGDICHQNILIKP